MTTRKMQHRKEDTGKRKLFRKKIAGKVYSIRNKGEQKKIIFEEQRVRLSQRMSGYWRKVEIRRVKEVV